MNIEQKALNYLLKTSEIVESGCREWRGPITKDGYGQLGVDWIIRTWGIKGAHRLMVRLAHGHEFAGRSEQVMHLCHNRRCIHPDHLEVGSAKRNMAAAKARGSRFGVRKISDDDVLIIRALVAMNAAAKWIASKFHLSLAHTYKIAHHGVWRDVVHASDASRTEMEAAARAMMAEAQSLQQAISGKAVA